MPSSVTTIGSTAFGNCVSLTSFDIPNTITTISEQAFFQCTSLTDVSIPTTVTSIGERAFYNCSVLTNVSVDIASPLTIDANVFEFISLGNSTLKVPAASVSTYTAADVWKDFGSITSL